MPRTLKDVIKTHPVRSPYGWFLAQLKPNGFLTAQRNLQRQGFTTFMPMREKTVRHARKRSEVLRPLFPGYIFVNFDVDLTQWRVINSTFGVLRLVTARPDKPQMAPEALMAALLARCGEQDVVLPPVALNAGDKVRVVDGPFRNIVAEVESMTAQNRVGLLLKVMGRATRANFAVDDLELFAVR